MSCRSKECHAALIELESLGFEEWTAQHTVALRKVVEACPDCNREWGFFQQSILIISTTSQPLPSPDQTRLMWQSCSSQIRRRPTERGDEPRLIHEINEQSRESAGKTPFWSGWLTPQPALGWAALGAAIAILIGVWLWTPEPATPAMTREAVAPLPEIRDANDLQAMQVSYSRPPAMASTLVNNHSMMGSGPCSNYIGQALVSYSAMSSPAP